MTPAEIERLRAERDEAIASRNKATGETYYAICERDEARAYTAAYREEAKDTMAVMSKAYGDAQRERDEARALLRECRPYLWHNEMNRPGNDLALLLARLDAFLAGEVSR